MLKSGPENASTGTPPNVEGSDAERISNRGLEPRLEDSESTHSESDAPCPFDSQSSLGDESGNALTEKTLCGRIATAFHLTKKDSGHIDQTIRSLNDFPSGYGKVAAIEDLDSDFLIYKKFGWLRNYALLHVQDELVELQQRLERLDKWEDKDGDYKKLLSRRKDYVKNDSGRKKLVNEIHSKLAQYDEALLRTQKIQSLKRPTERAQRNLHHLIKNTQSLVGNESEWTVEGPDLAALGRGPEYSWLNTFLEIRMSKISKGATRAIFRKEEQRIKTGDEQLQLLSADRFDVLVRIVLTLVAAILLLVPVYILFKLQPTSRADFRRNSNHQILTVFAFTLLFSASCSIFTKARRQEVFAATAAYGAVLVVFLGNASNVLANVQ